MLRLEIHSRWTSNPEEVFDCADYHVEMQSFVIAHAVFQQKCGSHNGLAVAERDTHKHVLQCKTVHKTLLIEFSCDWEF